MEQITNISKITNEELKNSNYNNFELKRVGV